MHNKISFFLVILFSVNAQASPIAIKEFEKAAHTSISQIVHKYSRHITTLEIARDYPVYSMMQYQGTLIRVVMVLSKVNDHLIQEVQARGNHKMMLLAPSPLTPKMLETLTRCEHFDVVMVQDISDMIAMSSDSLVEALINLGDYVYIEAHTSQLSEALKRKKLTPVIRLGQSELYLSYKPKKGLDIARFTQKDRAVSEKPRYQIESTFTRKFFIKKRLAPIAWIHGINLVSFVMLRGVYPTDPMICKEIVRMQSTHSYHNDLVLGNMIVQGDHIVPIDVDDARRNADFSHCFTSALKAFAPGNNRLANPGAWIQHYYNSF